MIKTEESQLKDLLIKLIRESASKKGLKLTAFSILVGMSKSQLCYLLKNGSSRTSLFNLFKILNTLGMDIDIKLGVCMEKKGNIYFEA